MIHQSEFLVIRVIQIYIPHLKAAEIIHCVLIQISAQAVVRIILQILISTQTYHKINQCGNSLRN